jgi:hypothetical protein
LFNGVYNKIVELWLADLQDEEREAQESQSLYRHKVQDDIISDADVDEKEFSSMFPTYEAIGVAEKQDMISNIETPSISSSVSRLSHGDKERVYRLHLCIMDVSHTGGPLHES